MHVVPEPRVHTGSDKDVKLRRRTGDLERSGLGIPQ